MPPTPDRAARRTATTAVEAVIEAITDGVKDGRYVPGQRLVEADLTRDLGVSRGPLREALGRLAAEGIVENEPYRGAVVRRLTRADVVDLFQIREVLEGEAARLAARAIDEGDHRRRMAASLRTLERFKRRPDTFAYMDENTRFHELVVELGGNKLLARLIGQLQVHAFRLLLRRLVADGNAVDDSIREHEAVAHAILDGDGRAAERAMRRHVRRSGEMVLRNAERVLG
ncbi:MAG TPA: GntR family transcriptional regulator [Acidimicrobiia bacterium]|nr:GntR family transcriptional regulator [Acidimicrobiia bacterium]